MLRLMLEQLKSNLKKIDFGLKIKSESLSTGPIESCIKLPEKPLGVNWYK
jgi:hypothetical protein